MRRSAVSSLITFAMISCLLACIGKPDPNTLVMMIESSPTNLDPRVGVDAQSERIDNLIFDDLLSRGDNLDVAPGLAERWEIPNPLTYCLLYTSIQRRLRARAGPGFRSLAQRNEFTGSLGEPRRSNSIRA